MPQPIPLPRPLRNVHAGFPPFMPGSGETVPADPADMLRDVFLANDGRIPRDKAENMVGRHTFTYGQKILDAWEDLQRQGFLALDGDDWIFPIQVAMANR